MPWLLLSFRDYRCTLHPAFASSCSEICISSLCSFNGQESAKNLMLALVNRCQNTQWITACCVWGCVATDMAMSMLTLVYHQHQSHKIVIIQWLKGNKTLHPSADVTALFTNIKTTAEVGIFIICARTWLSCGYLFTGCKNKPSDLV